MNEDKQKLTRIILEGILGLEFIKTLYRIFNLSIPVIGPICTMIDDARLFLTAVTIVILVYVVKEKTEKRTSSIVLGLLNIACIYEMYSDEAWINIKNIVIAKLVSVDLQMVIILFLVVLLVVFICLKMANTRKNKSEENVYANEGNTLPEKNSSFQKESQCNDKATEGEAGEEILISSSDKAVDEKFDAETVIGSDKKRSTVLEICFFSALFIILVAVTERWATRQLTKIELPQWWSLITLGLLILSILCVACAVVCLIIGLWKQVGKGAQRLDWFLNLLSLIISALLLYAIYAKNDLGSNLLDNFLTGIANNSIVSVLIVPVAVFMMLRIFLILLSNILFPKFKEASLSRNLRTRIKKIENGLISLVLNLYTGIINLFLFIPDFLNEICGLLLDSDDLFPHSKIDFKEDKSGTAEDGKKDERQETNEDID